MVVLLGVILISASPVMSAVADDISVTRTTQKAPVNFFFGVAVGNASYDQANNSDVGISVFAGIMPWRSLGFEIAYEYLGESVFGNTSFVNKTSLFRGGLVAKYPLDSGQIQSRFSVFGQIGVAMWDFDPIVNPGSGVDIYYGAGSTVQLGGGSNLRFAVNFYSVGAAPIEEDIVFLSIGFQQEF